MRQSDPRPWLHDILEAIVGVRAAVGSMTLEAYGASWTTRVIVTRQLGPLETVVRRLLDRLEGEDLS